MPVSDSYREMYSKMYGGEGMKNWRDVGGLAKAANICRLWAQRGLPEKPSVVEIGCGDGAVAEHLARAGFFREYQGFDLSDSAIRVAQERNIADARFSVADQDVVPLGDDTADLVIMSHVVEHLEHPRALLYEARRIAPLLIVEVPLEHHVRQPRDFVFDDLGHINAYTAKSIRRLVQSCRFRVLLQETTNVDLATRTFFDAGIKAKTAWRVKEGVLRTVPALGRALFTYHETLLAERQLDPAA